MKLLQTIALLSLALTAATARANDSYFPGVAGSPVPSKNENSSIRMESEKVVLTLRSHNLFDTDANFVFVNDANKKVTVRMGFPETNIGVIGDDETTSPADFGFKKFVTTVNWRRVAAKRTPTPGHSEYSHWWLKTVEFAPHERVRVRVMTTSRLGGDTSSASGILSYHFTGGNWKGLVSRSVLDVRVPQDGAWQASSFVSSQKDGRYVENKPQLLKRQGVGILRYEWKNWQAEGTASIGLLRVMPGALSYHLGSPKQTADYYNTKINFRVGKTIGTVDDSEDPLQGFVRDGVALVSFAYLAERASAAKIKQSATYDAATARATLQVNAITAAFVPGQKTMQVTENGQTRAIELRAAPILINVRPGGRKLYVPLREAARALGFTFDIDVQRHYLNVDLPKKADSAAPK